MSAAGDPGSRPSAGAVNPLQAAFGLFTAIPTRPLASVDRATARDALLALPWVGLGLGSGAAIIAGVVGLRGGGPLLGAVVAVALLALATGALHLDGLADTADGLGSRRPADAALVIMRRSDIGPMGVATLVLGLLFEMAALASPSLAWGDAGVRGLLAIALAPAIGRVAAVFACQRGVPAAREDGFGALFAGAVPPVAAGVDAAVVALASAAFGWWGGGLPLALRFLGACLVAWALGWGWRRHLVRRLGGMTGDTLGSLIMVGEATFLLAAALL